MNIDDILEEKRDLDLFLTEEMHRYVREDLLKKMNEVLGTEKNARNWFYSELRPLGGKRPYDYCKEGKCSEIKDLLGRIEYGVYS